MPNAGSVTLTIGSGRPNLCGKMADSRDFVGKGVLIGTAALAVALLACRTADLSGKGAEVVTSQSAPVDSGFDPSTCTHLGFVVGSGGGAFGGGWISNESLVNYAMNDLRNKAAEKGANFVQHDAPQMGVSGDKNGTSTTTATVSGNAYACSGQKSAAVTVTPVTSPAVAPVRPLPEGVAGFRLGSTVEQAKKICEDAGHQFTLSDASATCSSSVVDLKAPSEVAITFCDGQSCGIEVTLLPPPENLGRFIASLSKQLTAHYGEKTANKTDLKQCPNPAELAQCVMKDTAHVLHEWSWPSKHSVRLSSGKEKDRPCAKLTYLTPEFAKTRVPGPAI